MALALDFSAICAGEGNFLSPDEITAHLARVNATGGDRLIAKLTTAGLALAESK